MIKFFRKIRQQLLSQNRFSKYMLYAIGEILLVVIGILIALSINNWNEERKLLIQEKAMLTEIRNSLVSDLDNEIAIAIKGKERSLKRIATLITYVEQKYPYHDSLMQYFGVMSTGDSFEPQISAYKSLESQGLNLIRNDEIKREIMDIYNIAYPQLSSRVQNKVKNVHDYGRPLIRTKFRYIPSEGFKPLDYDGLKEDVEYWNILQTLRNNNSYLLRRANELIVKVESLVKLIDKEIGIEN